VVAGHEAQMVLGAADFMAWQSICMEEGEEEEAPPLSPPQGRGEVGGGREEVAAVVGFAMGEGGVG